MWTAAAAVHSDAKGADPSFRQDIAPILYSQCVPCHRPGQAGPFSLIEFGEVKARARLICEVTESRVMPPWLPDPQKNHFVGERYLNTEQIRTLAQWAAAGCPEGEGALPPLPPAPAEWELGPPDLVVTLPEPFSLSASGSDVYRNFAIPIPLRTGQWVETFEFHPGAPKNVHHAFLRFDRTTGSRDADEREPGPGFSGIHTPNTASTPEGFFSSWQPGKRVARRNDGLAWLLETNTDLVLQLHLNPSGKPEKVQSSVGFYYAKQKPKAFPVKVWLTSYTIDIPAGEPSYQVTSSHILPADATALGILPHAHYTAKSILVSVKEGGKTNTLLSIPRWDFNWQGDYAYRDPVALKKGSQISMTITYDNSAANPRNPSSPPQRVVYGLNSSNEMAEVWLQLLPANEEARQAYQDDFRARVIQDAIEHNEYLIKLNPADGTALAELGMAWLARQDPVKADSYFQAAIKAEPGNDLAYYYQASMLVQKGDLARAYGSLQRATRVNGKNFKSQGLMGIVCARMGKFDEAEQHYRTALRLNPNDSAAQQNLKFLETQRAAGPSGPAGR